jgi:SAM-dependent methyltransferase
MQYPHTLEYHAYLDRALLAQVDDASLNCVAEVCCGHGEALKLLQTRFRAGVGVDISPAMLESGRRHLANHVGLMQGDATRLPLKDEQFDHVFTLGGIHHVNDRAALFSEIFRILKPGGRFIWREPANDFWLWRALRAVIYRVSPALDEETEHPIRYDDTVPVLEQVGFQLRDWRTYGFLGCCVMTNSDVLIVNRGFRFVPGIRAIARALAKLDDLTTSFGPLRRAGLQSIGSAVKPQ